MSKEIENKRKIDKSIFALKRKDGKVFKIGDKFHYGGTSKTIVKGKISRRKMRICGFEKHERGWYVLYFPQYNNGVIEKINPWRACDLNRAILIK